MLKMTMIAVLLATSAAATAQTAKEPEETKLRCKRYEETGSFVKKRRVCMTEAQWREAQAETTRELREMEAASRINTVRPPDE